MVENTRYFLSITWFSLYIMKFVETLCGNPSYKNENKNIAFKLAIQRFLKCTCHFWSTRLLGIK